MERAPRRRNVASGPFFLGVGSRWRPPHGRRRTEQLNSQLVDKADIVIGIFHTAWQRDA